MHIYYTYTHMYYTYYRVRGLISFYHVALPSLRALSLFDLSWDSIVSSWYQGKIKPGGGILIVFRPKPGSL